MESIFKPYGYLSIKIVKKKEGDYAEIEFDRINNSLAAIREVNDGGRLGILATKM